MCPLVCELERRGGIESAVCLSSQHRELLYTVTELFGVRADYDLSLMRDRQSLSDIFCGVLRGMERVLAASVRACEAGDDPACPLLQTLRAGTPHG